MFLLRVVELEDFEETTYLTEEEIIKKFDGVLNAESLIAIDLVPLRARLIEHTWIKDVEITKRFPQTISVKVEVEKPAFLYKKASSAPEFLDFNGRVIGPYEPKYKETVPLLVSDNEIGLKRLIDWYQTWTTGPMAARASVHEIKWADQKKIRVIYEYQSNKNDANSRRVRTDYTAVEYLAEMEPAAWLEQDQRLNTVFEYLKNNRVTPKKILTGVDKKIVVRMEPGSYTSL